MSALCVTQLRRLLAAGVKVRLIAVAPASIIAGSWSITAVRRFPDGHPDAGLRYFALAPDPDERLLRGHYAPVKAQQGVRYLGREEAGVRAFLDA